MEPKWLAWSKRLASIAQNGLLFTRDAFDVERYQQVREIAAEIISSQTDTEVPIVLDFLSAAEGYATPRVDVRGVAFRAIEYCSSAKGATSSGVFPVVGQTSVRRPRRTWKEKSTRKRDWQRKRCVCSRSTTEAATVIIRRIRCTSTRCFSNARYQEEKPGQVWTPSKLVFSKRKRCRRFLRLG